MNTYFTEHLPETAYVARVMEFSGKSGYIFQPNNFVPLFV